MSPTQQHIARSEAQDKPWVAWSERRIVKHHGVGVRGVFLALALAVFGPMAILAVTMGIWGIVEGNPEGWGALLGGAVFASFLAVATYGWLSGRLTRKFGESVCHLETLPGVVGGWFKASVEVNLPVETLPTVLVKLENVAAEDSIFLGKGWAPTRIWEISERVFPDQLTHIQGDRYLVPVRFHIPAREDYYQKNRTTPGIGGWGLKITAELPGVNLDAGFPAPIFETDEAPPEEQTPEGDLWVVEVVYDKGWLFNLFNDKRFVSKLIAKAGRENTFSGWDRKRERDLGWYFKTEAEAQECANKFRGDPALLRVTVYEGAHQ